MKADIQLSKENVLGHFDQPELFLAGLDAETAASLISAAADVALILDDAGVIQDMAFASDELKEHGDLDWLGKPWLQTVTVESQPKIQEMLKEAALGGSTKWRHINHPSATKADLALSYTIVPVNREAGRRHSVAFGRDLRSQVALQQRLVSAQLSMERDYWRLRHIETRYRLLFQVASEAVLILDANSEKIEEANPAAFKLLGDKARTAGWTFIDGVDPLSVSAVRQLFAALRSNGRAEATDLDAGGSDLLHELLEGRIRNVVQVPFGKTGHFHIARLQVRPAQLLQRPDLRVNRVAGLIADACEIHVGSSG